MMNKSIIVIGLVCSAAVCLSIMNDVLSQGEPRELYSSLERQNRELKQAERRHSGALAGQAVGHSEPGVDWYIVPRTLSSDVPISKGLAAARSHLDMQEHSMALRKEQFTYRWTNIGPFSTAGRSRVVVFDPSNSRIMYTGAASGGVWKTTNGGVTWEPKTDHFTTLAIGHIAVDKNNPDIVYAGTGEGSDNWDRVYGDGLYRSSDGGETWANIMASRDVDFDECINKIALHPVSSDTVYAAIRGGSSGLYKTTDAGASWQYILSGVARDVTIDPHKPNRVYAALAHNRGDRRNGIYISDTNGVPGTFKRVDSLLPIGDSIGNIAMDVSLSKPGYMIAIMSKGYLINRTADGYIGNNDFLGIFRSTDYGESWYRTPASDDRDLRNVLRGQGDYNLYIRFHPADHNVVFIGGIHNWRSTDFGVTFTRVTNYDTWVDMHYADFSPDNPDLMAVASDGGVYTTDNCRATSIQWDERGGNLTTMQFYAMNYDPQQTRRVAGGTQDRRNNILEQGDPDWSRLDYGGDGGYVAFDAENSDIFYISSQYGNIARTTNGGASFDRITEGLGSTDRRTFGFVTPFVMHPDDSKVLFIGGQQMFRLNGVVWEPISGDLTGDSSSFSAFQDLSICKNHPNVLWGVTGSNKRVFKTTNAMDDPGAVQWQVANGDDVRYRVPGIFLATVTAHPDSADIAYVGTLEFQSRSGVYKTTDGGATWNHMKGGTPETTLPSVPVGAIAIYEPDPNIVFAGTDIGVYISRNGGGDWYPFNEGLPRVVIDDLKITGDGILYAASHGRGMWMTDISLVSVRQPKQPLPQAFTLGQNYPNPFNPSTTVPYTVGKKARYTLQVFDSRGRLLRTLVDAVKEPGPYSQKIDASGLPNGTYYYRLTGGSEQQTRKMVLMK